MQTTLSKQHQSLEAQLAGLTHRLDQLETLVQALVIKKEKEGHST